MQKKIKGGTMRFHAQSLWKDHIYCFWIFKVKHNHMMSNIIGAIWDSTNYFNICIALSIYNTECKLKRIIFSVHQVIRQQTSVNRMHARALFCISMGEFVSLSNCFCLLAYYCIPWVYHYANCHCTVNINQLMKQNRYSIFSFKTNANTTIMAFWKCFPP